MKPVLPLYAHLKEEILTAIAAGNFAPGDQLPSQRELIEQYNASHMTVRRAINELLQEGVIYAIPGKGLYVSEPKEVAESSPLMGFTEDMAHRGMKASSRVLAAELISASTGLSRTLEVEVGSLLVYLRRLRLADGIPIGVQAAYLKHSLCPTLLQYDLENHSMYDILREHFGLKLASARVSVEAILADEELSRLLGTQLPAALLVTEQLTFLANGEPLEFVRTTYRGDRYRLTT
jgi:GntR family transcriptional regulator